MSNKILCIFKCAYYSMFVMHSRFEWRLIKVSINDYFLQCRMQVLLLSFMKMILSFSKFYGLFTRSVTLAFYYILFNFFLSPYIVSLLRPTPFLFSNFFFFFWGSLFSNLHCCHVIFILRLFLSILTHQGLDCEV